VDSGRRIAHPNADSDADSHSYTDSYTYPYFNPTAYSHTEGYSGT
jgi:hypothetical protein